MSHIWLKLHVHKLTTSKQFRNVGMCLRIYQKCLTCNKTSSFTFHKIHFIIKLSVGVAPNSYQQNFNFNSIEIMNLNAYLVNFLKLILCFVCRSTFNDIFRFIFTLFSLYLSASTYDWCFHFC